MASAVRMNRPAAAVGSIRSWRGSRGIESAAAREKSLPADRSQTRRQKRSGKPDGPAPSVPTPPDIPGSVNVRRGVSPYFLLPRQVRRFAYCCLGIHNAASVQSCPVYRQRNTLIRRRSSTSFGNAVWRVAPWPVTRSADVSAGRWDALRQPETGSCARASAEPAR